VDVRHLSIIEAEEALRFRERYLRFLPMNFTCSECNKKIERDLREYYSFISLPDPSKKCPTCGHIPYVQFAYCSPECFSETGSDQAIERQRLEEEEIKKLMRTFKGLNRPIDREITRMQIMKNGGFMNFGVVHPAWDDQSEPPGKPTLHKKFPSMAKKLGFTVYRQGWPDFLIEKDGKYMGVEAKEGNGLGEHQLLMHQALESAGLRVIVMTPETAHLLDNFYNCLNRFGAEYRGNKNG